MTSTPNEWTILSVLEWGTSYFEKKGVNNPRLSIEWLLAHILGMKRLNLYLIFDRPVSAEELQEIKPLIKRRASHEPLQYIVGETDFYNTRIKVTPDVLIPRPETEELVEQVLTSHKKGDELTVLDIGTGSGCIPIALKKNAKSWSVFGTDISSSALKIAKQNAALNDVEISFFEDDLFNSMAFVDKQFDIIISNPPYILREEESSLDDEVKNFEPDTALFCDSTQEMYQALFDFADRFLVSGGTLYLELNARTATEVDIIFENENWTASILKDLGEKPRFLVAKKI
ncbi:MAG: peptide chain release factor N(5)-glutamine methyltransferase [Balneola sp.]|nr:MAG: peptide chain release factor N(5)-glutamine methyltransferase [Balneola sp.]